MSAGDELAKICAVSGVYDNREFGFLILFLYFFCVFDFLEGIEKAPHRARERARERNHKHI